jgi:hypothetical protein
VVRPAERRQQKFARKVDADVLRTQTIALKPLMVEGQSLYFPNMASLEAKVKVLVEAEGVTTLQVRDYLNFAREMYKISKQFSSVTLSAEAQTRVDKWVSRNLAGSLLVKIAQLFGVTPSAAPTPPTILNLDDLQDVEITAPADQEVLTFEEATALWKNKPIPTPTVDFSWMRHRKSGYYHNLPLVNSTTTITFGNYILMAFAFHVPTQQTFDRIAIHVTTTTVSGKIGLGIYADNGDVYPSSLLLDAGTVDISSTGLKEIEINVTLEKGLYWLALLSVNISGTFYLGATAVANQFAPIGRSSPYAIAYNNYQFISFETDLPDPFPEGATISATAMPIALRKA